MAGIESERAHDVREALHIIASDPGLGAATFANPQAMSNLLKDLLPDAPREKNLLYAAAEAGLSEIMLDHVAQGLDPGSATRLAAASFAANTHFTDNICIWVATELAVALGLEAETSHARTAMPVDQLAAPVAAEAPATVEIPPSAVPAQAAQVPAPLAAEPVQAAPAVAEPVSAAGQRATDRASEMRSATELLGEEEGEAGTALRGADASAHHGVPPESPAVAVSRRRPRPSAVLAIPALAGAVIALVGFLLPAFTNPDANNYHVDIFQFSPAERLALLAALVLAAAGGGLLARSRLTATAHVVAEGLVIAAGVVIGLEYIHVYLLRVRDYGDPMDAGLIVSLLGAVLLLIAGVGGLVWSLASRRATTVSDPGGS